MKQTTRNLIRGAAVTACMAFPVSSLAIPIHGSWGGTLHSQVVNRPLLDEGRDIKPKVVAQLQAIPMPENKYSPKRVDLFNVNTEGQSQTNLETPQKQPKKSQTSPYVIAAFAFAISAVLFGSLVYVRNVILHPMRRRNRNAHPEGEQNKGDQQ